ncbi:MarR family winged helix-turn-helix transcriptional regulator [Ruegeria marina]|uniref:DNA-binding transcriptional regulator, MarR family n=1 Tax=Ruegeria marina TaxID=639004 RepID=A0A1G7AMY1_9RHOB|nr:MarR family transcriptional regulator [Ruegeria marina]SDE16284.1 DNA-binding transcriptional regulator, MarR family [Ruegeria marina]
MGIENQDPPEFHLSVLNMQIREMMNAVLRPHGLKLVEWRLLQCLADQGALSICDLATLAVIERTATSRLVDRMLERGLVSKEQMEDDRRFSRVSLCDAGRVKLEACTEDVHAVRQKLFEGLEQVEIASLLTILKRLQRGCAAVMADRVAIPIPARKKR